MSQPVQNSLLQDFSNALSENVTRAAGSVVAIHSGHSHSSGFLWRSGLIVTADEALAEDADISVALPDGKAAAAAVVGRDPTTDIALLRVDRVDIPTVQLHSIPVKAGALAWAIGSQAGAALVAFGAVSFVGGSWRSLRGGDIEARIELDLSLRRSGEGGLAMDASGRAFGMAVLGARRQVLVIPAATIQIVAEKLQTDGRIPRGYLGLGLKSVKLDGNQGTGLIVMNVDPNGPGATARLQQGDIITRWNDQEVRDVNRVVGALGPSSVGSQVKLVLRRSAATLEVTLTVGERPER